MHRHDAAAHSRMPLSTQGCRCPRLMVHTNFCLPCLGGRLAGRNCLRWMGSPFPLPGRAAETAAQAKETSATLSPARERGWTRAESITQVNCPFPCPGARLSSSDYHGHSGSPLFPAWERAAGTLNLGHRTLDPFPLPRVQGWPRLLAAWLGL